MQREKWAEGGGPGGTRGGVPARHPPPSDARGRSDPLPSKAKLGRPPKSAAVVITCPEGQYEATMRKTREKTTLALLGIDPGDLQIKRAIIGALTYEVRGEEHEAKADALASELRNTLADRPEVLNSKPHKTAEIRLWAIDVAAEPDEVRRAMAADGGCKVSQIMLRDLRKIQGGLGAWARCPLTAAHKIVAAGGPKIGWTKAKVQVLQNRPCSVTGVITWGMWQETAGGRIGRSAVTGAASRDITLGRARRQRRAASHAGRLANPTYTAPVAVRVRHPGGPKGCGCGPGETP